MQSHERTLLRFLQERELAPYSPGTTAQRAAIAGLMEQGLVFKGRAGYYLTSAGDEYNLNEPADADTKLAPLALSGGDYPPTNTVRGGCKVAWLYYDNEADAKKCAAIAERTAARQRDQGYDYGFQVPGTITGPDDQQWFPGMWEVCIP